MARVLDDYEIEGLGMLIQDRGVALRRSRMRCGRGYVMATNLSRHLPWVGECMTAVNPADVLAAIVYEYIGEPYGHAQYRRKVASR